MEVENETSFFGEYRHNLDAKKRLIVPSKFRDSLSDTFFVTRGFDGCLAVYTKESFQEQLEELRKLPRTSAKARQYIRSITSKVAECSLDAQGRLQLPPYLIELAEIQKQVVFVGADLYFEIWAEEKWDKMDELSDSSFEDNAEEMTGFLQKL